MKQNEPQKILDFFSMVNTIPVFYADLYTSSFVCLTNGAHGSGNRNTHLPALYEDAMKKSLF